MKRAFIIHGWDFNPNMNWYPWLKKELEKKGYGVVVPIMPHTSKPKIDDWVSHVKKVVGKLDDQTYFVGHSMGCQAIMRYLEKENYLGKVGKIVFVAGWLKLNNLEGKEVENIARPWLETPIDQKKPEDSILSRTTPWFLSTIRILIKNSEVENGDEWGLFVSLKIRCGKDLRTDFAIHRGVGDFANFYDFNKVKEKTGQITIFLSSNDPYGYLEYNFHMFKKNLGAKVIILKDKGHFTGDDGVTQLNNILEELNEN